MRPPPLSLYIHLPWCVKKCPYCDFNSHSAGAGAPKERYIQAVLNDLRCESATVKDRCIESIFLGGGTPSLFSASEIQELLDGVRAVFQIAEHAEVTLEANPGTVECGSLGGYRDAGINRLSIGAQSFEDAMLAGLGRVHSSDDIYRTIREARHCGFDNFNIDLMHGLPGQSARLAAADLRAAIDLGPSHISWYQLTLEPNTVFYARPPANLPDEDLLVEIYDHGQVLLARSGFEQYEVSAYARAGRRCAHNLNYWRFGDYLAVGAGAHGKLSTEKGVHRYQKPANPQQYMMLQEAGAKNPELRLLGRGDLIFEFMLNALRLSGGFDTADFLDRTGLSTAQLDEAITPAVQKGLLERVARSGWKPTKLGRRFLNDLQAEFITEDE